jgi:cysteinyl-tRNA synthetase
VEVAPYKKNAMDFVLWKPSKPGEPAWPSPSGIAAPGRPGWHIECSAMSWKHLGETFDINGGGIDLVFPHHENEIAQSRCAFHTPVMANFWMHNGFLQVEGEKMAKSAGNFVTIRELLNTKNFGERRWSGQVLRLAMLQTHYRQPINWTLKGLSNSDATLDDWFFAAKPTSNSSASQSILAALADDLNTPKMIAEVHAIRRRIEYAGVGPAAVELGENLAFLGFSRQQWMDEEDEINKEVLQEASKVQELIDARASARKARNFKEADRIRDELAAMGVVLHDSKDGTTWEIAR